MSYELVPPFSQGGPPPFSSGAVPPGSVGDFRQGSPVSQWALARYLVGRAVGTYISRVLAVLAVLLFAGGVALFDVGLGLLGVLVIIAALVVLAARGLLGAVLRRLGTNGSFGPDEARLRELVSDTRADVRRELRLIGLPGRSWTMPLLVVRLVGRRRAETVEKLRHFDVERVVPAARLDELHMIVRAHLQPPPY
jgi:hypothetical protein